MKTSLEGMQMKTIRLSVNELFEIEKLLKFVGKQTEGVNFRTIGGALRATATDINSFKTVILCETKAELDGRGITVRSNEKFKTALSSLTKSLKKFPDQVIELTLNGNHSMIGYADCQYPIDLVSNEFIEFAHVLETASGQPANYFSINVKLLKRAIDSMNDDMVFIVIPKEKQSIIIRERGSSFCVIGSNVE